MPVPAGFLRPGYLPSGFRVAGVETGTGGSNGEVTSFAITFKPGEGAASSPAFAITEAVRPGGLTAAQRVGDAVSVRGTDGYLATDGMTTTLTWAERGHVVTIAAAGISAAEVMAIADGLAAER